jgi:predicted nucleic acid-binding protein
VILLDTNVISELVKPQPNQTVVAYVAGLAPETVFTAAICEAEIRYGLARPAPGRRRDGLIARMTTFFETGFPDQVLRFDRACAAVYGEIRHAPRGRWPADHCPGRYDRRDRPCLRRAGNRHAQHQRLRKLRRGIDRSVADTLTAGATPVSRAVLHTR